MSCAFSILKPLNPREDTICRFLPIILWLKRLSVPSNNACPTYGWPGDMIKREPLNYTAFHLSISCSDFQMHKHFAWNQDKQMEKVDWFDVQRWWRTKNEVYCLSADPYSKPNTRNPVQRSLECKWHLIWKYLCRNSKHLIIVQPEPKKALLTPSVPPLGHLCDSTSFKYIANESSDGLANEDFKTPLEDWINGLVIHSLERPRAHFIVLIYAPLRRGVRLNEQYSTTGVAHNGTNMNSQHSMPLPITAGFRDTVIR